MRGMIPAKAARFAVALLAASAMLALTAGAASAAEVIYANSPSPLPGNLPSLGYDATQTSEFGGAVEFAGTARANPTVLVTMSSWGCQTGHWTTKDCKSEPSARFAWPVTISIYEVGPGNTVGAKIAAGSKTFKMPYRPSASSKCKGAEAGKWFFKGHCFNGKAFRITLGLKVAKLPAKAIVSVAYNTTGYGAQPVGSQPCTTTPAGCPYDSLNVAVREATEPGPSIGADPLPEDAFINSTTAGNYCEAPAGVGTFAISKGCWKGEQPAIEVKAS
jgi:hypothetical protein